MPKETPKRIEKRRQIVERAIELMKNVHFEDLTVRMICDAAGISIGTFYHYFTEKSDLIVDLYSFVDEYLLRKVVPELTQEDELANLMRFCTGFAEYVTQCGVARSRIINCAVYPRAWPEGEQTRPLFAELHRVLLRGQQKGQISNARSAAEITGLVVIMLRGCCFDWARRGGDYDLVERTLGCARLFIDGLNPSPSELYGARLSPAD